MSCLLPRRRCARRCGSFKSACGFTLIELIVVMAIVAMLITLSLPRYARSVEKSREAVLRHDLRAMRDAIDQFMSDQNRYPATLAELVEQHYLRAIPHDPLTDSDSTWVLIAPPPVDGGDPSATGSGSVFDVRSGASGNGLDGSAYERW